MSLGLCLCQGAGQRVPTMCSGVGCECSNASPFLCCCVPSSIQKHWKTAQPLCNTPDSAVQPHLHELCCWCPPARHAACPSRRLGLPPVLRRLPAQHRAHACSPGALLGTALALATLTALRGAAHNARPHVLWSSRQALVPAMPCLGAKQKRRRDLTLKLPYG